MTFYNIYRSDKTNRTLFLPGRAVAPFRAKTTTVSSSTSTTTTAFPTTMNATIN